MKPTRKPHHPSSAASLFNEPPNAPERPLQVYIANVDGASRGNPGPAAYAVVVRAPDGSTVFELGKYLGRTTNNVAEYYALISALDYAASHGIARLRVRSDSELLVRQMQGRYKVKSADLRPLHERAQKTARQLAYFAIEHVPREQNRDADALANRALDETSTHAPATHASAARGAVAEPAERASTPTPARGARRGHTLRARYAAGALHPLEALDLDEGEVVEITLRASEKIS